MNKKRIDPEVIKAVAQRLKQVRESKGLSQETTYIDTDYNIGRLESGTTNITVSTLSILCKYYGVTLEDFFKGL